MLRRFLSVVGALFIVFVLFVSLLVIATWSHSSPAGADPVPTIPHPDKSADAAPSVPVPQSAPPAPALRISAMVLDADYAANEVAADRQFQGRRLEVWGITTGIEKDMFGNVHVTMAGAGELGGFGDVNATMNRGNEDEAAELARGLPAGVICTKVERVVATVMLSGCDFAPPEKPEAAEPVQPEAAPAATTPQTIPAQETVTEPASDTQARPSADSQEQPQ